MEGYLSRIKSFLQLDEINRGSFHFSSITHFEFIAYSTLQLHINDLFATTFFEFSYRLTAV